MPEGVLPKALEEEQGAGPVEVHPVFTTKTPVLAGHYALFLDIWTLEEDQRPTEKKGARGTAETTDDEVQPENYHCEGMRSIHKKTTQLAKSESKQDEDRSRATHQGATGRGGEVKHENALVTINLT